MKKSIYARQTHQLYWVGTILGSLPFLLIIAAFFAPSTRTFPFNQSFRLVLYLSGVEVVATVICLFIKQLRQVGYGIFTSLFFTPVALLSLSFIIVLIFGPTF